MNSHVIKSHLYGHTARAFVASDLERMRLRDVDRFGIAATGIPDIALATAWAASGSAITLLRDDEPVAAGGVLVACPGVGCGWFLGSDALESSLATRKATIRLTRAMIPYFMRGMGLRRMEARVRIDNDSAVIFTEHLGFRLEGVMRRFFADWSAAGLYAFTWGE